MTTAAKPIPAKTAARLARAREHLDKMAIASESSAAFARELAAFLTDARSVKDILKREIASGNRPAKAYIENAMKAPGMVETRDSDVHKGDLDIEIEWIPDRIGRTGDPGLDDFFRRHRLRRVGTRPAHQARIVGMPTAVEQLPRAFFAGDRGSDAYTRCVVHLDKVRQAVEDCVQRFG